MASLERDEQTALGEGSWWREFDGGADVETNLPAAEEWRDPTLATPEVKQWWTKMKSDREIRKEKERCEEPAVSHSSADATTDCKVEEESGADVEMGMSGKTKREQRDAARHKFTVGTGDKQRVIKYSANQTWAQLVSSAGSGPVLFGLDAVDDDIDSEDSSESGDRGSNGSIFDDAISDDEMFDERSSHKYAQFSDALSTKSKLTNSSSTHATKGGLVEDRDTRGRKKIVSASGDAEENDDDAEMLDCSVGFDDSAKVISDEFIPSHLDLEHSTKNTSKKKVSKKASVSSAFGTGAIIGHGRVEQSGEELIAKHLAERLRLKSRGGVFADEKQSVDCAQSKQRQALGQWWNGVISGKTLGTDVKSQLWTDAKTPKLRMSRKEVLDKMDSGLRGDYHKKLVFKPSQQLEESGFEFEPLQSDSVKVEMPTKRVKRNSSTPRLEWDSGAQMPAFFDPRLVDATSSDESFSVSSDGRVNFDPFDVFETPEETRHNLQVFGRMFDHAADYQLRATVRSSALPSFSKESSATRSKRSRKRKTPD